MKGLLILFIFVAFVLMTYLIKCILSDNLTCQQFKKNTSKNPVKNFKYIPKKIFQLVADKNDIHPIFQKNIEHIKKLNPDWEYTLYDDNDIFTYIQIHYPPYILDIYKMINPKYGAARADFFRYLLMYKEGGVYLDIKSGMKMGLNYILKNDDEYVLCHWPCSKQSESTNSRFGELQQWNIICRPNHPFLEAVINNVVQQILKYDIYKIGTGKNAVLKVTGPIVYTKSIIPLLNDYHNRIIESHLYIGLVYNNINSDHIGMFKHKHYSKLSSPVILT